MTALRQQNTLGFGRRLGLGRECLTGFGRTSRTKGLGLGAPTPTCSQVALFAACRLLSCLLSSRSTTATCGSTNASRPSCARRFCTQRHRALIQRRQPAGSSCQPMTTAFALDARGSVRATGSNSGLVASRLIGRLVGLTSALEAAPRGCWRGSGDRPFWRLAGRRLRVRQEPSRRAEQRLVALLPGGLHLTLPAARSARGRSQNYHVVK